jgi:hypothetical protein
VPGSLILATRSPERYTSDSSSGILNCFHPLRESERKQHFQVTHAANRGFRASPCREPSFGQLAAGSDQLR